MTKTSVHNEIIVKKDGRRELDLIAAIKILFKKVWLIALISLLCGALFFSYTYYMVEPEYQANMSLYVSNVADSSSVGYVTTSDISASMMLMYTYAHVIKGEETISKIITLSDTDYSIAQMTRMIDITSIENTKILVVTATSNDPKEVVQILDAVAEIAPELPNEIERGSSVTVLSRAKQPQGRSSPSYSKVIFVGMVVGLFVSIVMILGRAITNTKIRNVKDIATLGYPVLGTISLAADQRKNHHRRQKDCGYLLEDDVSFNIYQNWNRINKNIMFSLPKSDCKKILFTSGSPNVRKGTVAMNLARLMAKDAHSVLLMDCNLCSSEFARALNLEDNQGLSSVLSGQADLESAIQHYDDKLDVITAGHPSLNPEELLGSNGMQLLLQKIEKDYSYVFMNTAPILDKDLNSALYGQVSGVVLVARAGVTRRPLLRDYIDEIKSEGGTVLGVILSTDKRK